MIRIAICDDEAAIREQLSGYLKEYPMELAVDVYAGGEELLLCENAYEIILLDIDMEGKSGIETAEELRRRDKSVKIIYITNYSDYTVFAFAVHAFAYLLKPVERKVLYEQLDEAFLYMQIPRTEMMEFMTEEGLVRLDSAEILCFEYFERRVLLRTQKHTYVLKRKITELAQELGEETFFMPHKSFIVNLYAVKRIEGYDIILTNGSCIPLSQKKSVAFRTALNCYLSKRKGIHF